MKMRERKDGRMGNRNIVKDFLNKYPTVLPHRASFLVGITLINLPYSLLHGFLELTSGEFLYKQIEFA